MACQEPRVVVAGRKVLCGPTFHRHVVVCAAAGASVHFPGTLPGFAPAPAATVHDTAWGPRVTCVSGRPHPGRHEWTRCEAETVGKAPLRILNSMSR